MYVNKCYGNFVGIAQPIILEKKKVQTSSTIESCLARNWRFQVRNHTDKTGNENLRIFADLEQETGHSWREIAVSKSLLKISEAAIVYTD